MMGSRHSVRCRWAGLCWREGGSRLLRTLVLRKRSCGPAPAGPPVRRVAAGIAIRLEQARAGCGGRCPWLSGVFAPTQKQHKPGARAKINTGVTRTKRHSPAYGGTRSTMAVPENLASSPAEMRVSWADYPFPGRWAKGDRPSEKRKVGSSILPLTTSLSSRENAPSKIAIRAFSLRWGLSLGPRSKRTIGGSAGTGKQAGPSRFTTSSSKAWRQTAARQCAPCPLGAAESRADGAGRRTQIIQVWMDDFAAASACGGANGRPTTWNRASAMTFCDPLVNGRRGYLSDFVLGLVGGESPRCR